MAWIFRAALRICLMVLVGCALWGQKLNHDQTSTLEKGKTT